MSELKALLISTSNNRLGDTMERTGVWAETLAVPYYFLRSKGYDVQIASIRGGRIPFDPLSITGQDTPLAVKEFLTDEEAMTKSDNSVSIVYTQVEDYNAVFIAGGHGIAWDGPYNQDLVTLIESAYKYGRAVAAIGHGVAPIAFAKRPDGKPLVYGKQVTGFSNKNEQAMGRVNAVPFLVEDKLKAQGAIYQRAEGLETPFAVRSDLLITGQNPASSKQTSELLVETQTMGVRLTP